MAAQRSAQHRTTAYYRGNSAHPRGRRGTCITFVKCVGDDPGHNVPICGHDVGHLQHAAARRRNDALEVTNPRVSPREPGHLLVPGRSHRFARWPQLWISTGA
jgi:hypothetical protein